MKPPVLIAIVAAWVLLAGPGMQEGRRGNARYAAGDFGEAAAAYEAGLSARAGREGAVTFALWHNLGLARMRLQEHEASAQAFARARDAALTPEGFARAAYNAGLDAAAQSNTETALRLFRDALLADPSHDDARHNYELLRRQQPPQEPPSDRPPPVEPSAFAQRAKAQADSLVARQRYADAARLLQDALRQDSTVRAYQSFVQRVSDVAMIDDASPPQ